jgi:hypothetical protein
MYNIRPVSFDTQKPFQFKKYITDFRFLENPRQSIMFNGPYRASYMRSTPYITGMAMSFIISKLKEKKIKPSLVKIY